MTASVNILVIEDDASDFHLIKRFLQYGGLEASCRQVSDAEDLADALNQENAWDAVLVDYNVPGLDFNATISKLRSGLRDVPLILVSGHVDEEDAVGLMRQGVWDFVLKDHLVRLALAVRRALNEADGRRAQRESALLQAQLNMVASTVPGVIFSLRQRSDGTFCIPYVSPTIARFIELPDYFLAEDASPLFESVHPDDQKRLHESLAKSALEFIPWRLEFRFLHADKQDFWVEINARPHRDEGDSIIWHGFLQDITERRNAEQAVRNSEELFRTASDGIHDAFVITDGNQGRVIWWNPAAERIFGYRSEEMLGNDLHALLTPPELRDAAYQGLVNFASHGTGPAIGQTLELVALRKGGDRFPIELSLSSMALGGKWYGVGIARDISARKQAEGEIRILNAKLEQRVAERTAELKESEERHRKIFECSHDAIMTLAPPEWRFTSGNPATLAMFRARDEAEFISLSPHGLSPERQPDGRFSLEKSMDMIGVAMRDGVNFFEWTHKRLDGNEFQATVLLTRMTLKGKAFLLATVRDVTKQKQAEEALVRLNETLAQQVEEKLGELREKDLLLIQQSRLAAMGEMVHNIAHQWRQPLSSLSLVLQNIAYDYEENTLTSEALREYVSKGTDMARAMSATIDNFRDFFRPNHHVKTGFSLLDAVDDALKMVASSFKIHGIEIVVEAREDIQVTGFPNEFSQVVLNLLGNAKDAIMESKKRKGRIDIFIGQADKIAHVVIHDNGAGIPDEILENIFDPYFTTKSKGSGIGLYMSKMIMERMDGTIHVQNTELGAEFILALPVL